MTFIPQFLSSWQRYKLLAPDEPLSTLTCATLSVVDVLPGVEAAAMCLMVNPVLRVAVGVSDGSALLAEQLEFTIGDGPGLAAVRDQRSVAAGSDFRHRWPVLHEALSSATSYRAVHAAPLSDGTTNPPRGVLVLLYETPELVDQADDHDRLDIAQVGLLVGHALTMTGLDLADPDQVRATHIPDIHRRLTVQTCIDLVMIAAGWSRTDTLAVIRGYAWSRSRTLDDVAYDLLHGHLTVNALA